VRIGGDDGSVTGAAGLVLVAEVDRILGVGPSPPHLIAGSRTSLASRTGNRERPLPHRSRRRRPRAIGTSVRQSDADAMLATVGSGTEAIIIGGGLVLFSLFFGMYANDDVPDKSSYDWAFVQRHRLPGIVARTLGIAILVLGIVLSVSDLVV